MKRITWMGALALLWLCPPLCAAPPTKEVAELGKFFREREVVGTFVMLDPEADTMIVWNEARATQRYVPASTFKIANSLLGLHFSAVSNIEEVLPYGGKPQRLKQWEQDMHLRDAFKVSNVPVYKELARRIGLERMREGLKLLAYGNMETGAVIDQFWLEGPLMISAQEQVQFLSRLTSGRLPLAPGVVQAVKEIALAEKTESYSRYAKTGWYWPGDGGQQIGWYVGWIERDGKQYPFALNIDIKTEADAAKRLSIARDCLQALGKL